MRQLNPLSHPLLHLSGFRRGDCGRRNGEYSPFEVVKCASVQLIVGLIVVIIVTEFRVPQAAIY
ncbi:hypothetical protein [Kosakonia arachidis]|uniref:hypothetical protein n=1 Tax=Kosakonia arachidis TaxID=551989 RepID=UPI000B7FEE08